MSHKKFNRRLFMQSSSIAVAAFMAAPKRNAVSANDKIRLAQIGIGGRGSQNLKSCSRIADFEIVALCDLRSERVERGIDIAKTEGHDPKGYTDFEKMLEEENLDAVSVCTEVANHAQCVIPVLEAGLHCFSEKPVDCTVEKVDAITQAARKAKGIYQVGFQRRYNPTFVKGISEAHSDRFGNLTFLQGHWYFPGKPGGWVLDVEMSGGKLVEQACHHMDVMTWVTGSAPVKCTATGAITVDHSHRSNLPEHLAEDHSSLNFEFENGVVLTYTHFSNVPKLLTEFSPSRLIEARGEKLWVFKDTGLLDLSRGLAYPHDGEPENFAEATDYFYGSFRQFESFVKDMRNNRKPASHIESARIATLTAIMGHTAMYDWEKKKYGTGTITWEQLASKTNREK